MIEMSEGEKPKGPSKQEQKRQELAKLKKIEPKIEKLVNEVMEELETASLKKDCYFNTMQQIKFNIARLQKELGTKK